MFDAIRDHKSPVWRRSDRLRLLINSPDQIAPGINHKLAGQVAAAAPPRTVIEGGEQIGIALTHVYGLTETYGPAALCAKHPESVTLPLDRRAERNRVNSYTCRCKKQ